ncbi:hypothetical protein A5662_26120 [Mycobacteriaceae bacterium 1482268.1]|nr:hypothetical protein A5662_26120 [Mycobacteriaceae bacterium 1482268.1]
MKNKVIVGGIAGTAVAFAAVIGMASPASAATTKGFEVLNDTHPGITMQLLGVEGNGNLSAPPAYSTMNFGDKQHFELNVGLENDTANYAVSAADGHLMGIVKVHMGVVVPGAIPTISCEVINDDPKYTIRTVSDPGQDPVLVDVQAPQNH